ncbi:MAG: NAD(P)-dependent oxidoreductase [Deltaproteobacteria bacterium]|nr:NAD(P)-dependent oxidoreductase [Deltaproteobacteria bacterium]
MNNSAYEKVLITGATGFVGSHLAKRLVSDGKDVHLIVRPGSDLSPLNSISEKITLHCHDGSTEGMFSVVEKAEPHIVFHLASLFLAQHESKDVAPMIESNILFATQLAEAMTKFGVNSLINTGTAWQHYNNEDYNPVCLYAATKEAYEDILRYYTETTGLKVITLKLYDTYGPGDMRPKLFSLLNRVAREKETMAMSPGEQLIDILYIDDVINAFIIAAHRVMDAGSGSMESFALSSGNPLKLKELILLYGEVFGEELTIEWGQREYRQREVMVPWNRGEVLPGWKPEIALREGIKKIIQEE